MELLNKMLKTRVHHQVGRLAVKDSEDEDSIVYVVWEIGEQGRDVRLVELDRPQDGENHFVNLDEELVYLLEPIEVLERVTQW